MLAPSPELQRHLTFRDYLRAQPEPARAYAELKRRLAAKFRDDGEGHNQAKAGFVTEILSRAKSESG